MNYLHYSGKHAKEIEGIHDFFFYTMAKQPPQTCTLEIPRHLHDMRIDRAWATLVTEQYPDVSLSRASATRLINEGRVLCNGKPVLARSLVTTHDVLTFPEDIFSRTSTAALSSQQEVPDLQIYFENDQFLIVEKPAGMQMHRGGSYTGVTVADWVLTHAPALVSVGEDASRPGIVHRLDRDTSGVLVIAKTQEVFQKLKQAFQERQVQKTYLALVHGHLREHSGQVTASLMRLPGDLKRRTIDPERFSGALPGNTRSALTQYQVLTRYESYDLVVLTPKTGRTHQIRAHMAYLGHPVVGDQLYAFKESKKHTPFEVQRQLLHAARLAFTLDGKEYQFSSPLPVDFRRVLESLDFVLAEHELQEYL
jgi:23S rRNA pseudouridine1911/1915/1917 synthase